MSKFPIKYMRFQCDMIAKLFIYSAKMGIDSDDFCYKLLNSTYGVDLLTDNKLAEYCGESFMFEGLENELNFKRGSYYSIDILYYVGYLYKYWISTRNIKPQDVYKIAPISMLAKRYEFYHTQDWDYVINDIVKRPFNS